MKAATSLSSHHASTSLLAPRKLLLLLLWCHDVNVQAIEITANLLNQTYNSALLAMAAVDDDPAAYAEANGRFEVYGTFPSLNEDGTTIDYTIVAKKDGVCYGAWRATTPKWDDWSQNFNLLTENVENCFVHRGFERAYSERDLVDAALSACLASCGDDGENNDKSDCPLVLTGQSQGAATAVIASLYWRSKNPDVITFGAPRAVHNNCHSLQANKHYRFVNVQVSNGVLQYDAVTLLPTLGGTHYGQTFLLNGDGGLAYVGYGDDNMGNIPNLQIHFMRIYLERIEKMAASATFPMYSNGWENDEACGVDDECSSGRCEGIGVGGAFPPFKCRALKGSCSTCNENNDCESGKCVFIASMVRSYCAGDSTGMMDDGCRCDLSSNCRSGRCEGFFPPYTCEARLSEGQGCNENTDCESGSCDGWPWDRRCR